jgi:hypothetical protein
LVRGPPSFEGKDASLAVKAEFKTVELLPGRLFACYQFVKNSNRSRLIVQETNGMPVHVRSTIPTFAKLTAFAGNARVDLARTTLCKKEY